MPLAGRYKGSPRIEVGAPAAPPALNQEGERFHLAREMSEVLGIPAPFLGKILQPLVMRGVLESQRGRNGGFRLLGDPSEVTLMQIADSQELIYEKRQCFLG